MSTSSPASSWWPEARKQARAARADGSDACGGWAADEPQPAASASAAIASPLARRLRLPLLLAQLDPANLAGQRLRQVLHELDPARIRVLRQAAADEGADVGCQVVAWLMAFGQDDERLHDVAAALLRRGDGGSFAHGRMLDAC